MEECASQVKQSWIVIPVWVAPNGVAQLNYKLPHHIVKITGVAFTQSELQADFREKRVGTVSLQTNNKQSHPINFDVEHKSKVSRIDKELIKLAEPIVGGTRLFGYYRNVSAVEHILKIYLQCY